MKHKKAQGLPVNVVVTLIIGIIIFGLGMGLFYKISSSGEDIVNDLNKDVKQDIANLECDGEEWICSPSYTMKKNEVGRFQVYVANKGNERIDNVRIEFPVASGEELPPKDCGTATIYYPTIEVNIQSGESASFPFSIRDVKVKDKCSFVTSATLIASGDADGQKAAVIIRVE